MDIETIETKGYKFHGDFVPFGNIIEPEVVYQMGEGSIHDMNNSTLMDYAGRWHFEEVRGITGELKTARGRGGCISSGSCGEK
jgi:hypothetical protein